MEVASGVEKVTIGKKKFHLPSLRVPVLSLVSIRPHGDHTQKNLLRCRREGNRGYHFGEVRRVSLTRQLAAKT
jgi:hypothetical protein